jgi:hypothetical protein
MTENTPPRRPATHAKVGDIVQSHNDPGKAMWKVEAVREVPGYRNRGTRILFDLRSLTSNRTDVRSAGWLEILSPEEVARLQAKRQERTLKLTPAEADALFELLSNEPLVDHDRVSPDGDHPPLTSVFEKLAEVQKKAAA